MSLVWNRFITHSPQVSIYHIKVWWILIIPHESQVWIYHNQCVVDFCLVHLWKGHFKIKTAIISVSQLSHRPRLNKDVARSCTCPYGDAKDVLFFEFPNSVCHLPWLQSYQYNNGSIIIVQVSMYDISMSWILRCMYLYIPTNLD